MVQATILFDPVYLVQVIASTRGSSEHRGGVLCQGQLSIFWNSGPIGGEGGSKTPFRSAIVAMTAAIVTTANVVMAAVVEP